MSRTKQRIRQDATRKDVVHYPLQVDVIPFEQSSALSLRQNVDMATRACTVVVKQVPERLNENGGRLFFKELESCMNVNRPSIVFDCSKVSHMDRTSILILLCCLEEAIKRNGDVKLAAISAEARVMMTLSAADRLFEIFDTAEEAASSFRQHSPYTISNNSLPVSSPRTTANLPEPYLMGFQPAPPDND
jgi:anti-sigma B factor antagonist